MTHWLWDFTSSEVPDALCVSQCASHYSGYYDTAVWNGVVCNEKKPLHLSSTVVIQLCFYPSWFFLFFCFLIGWIWCLWKWETSITGWSKVLHKHYMRSSANAPLSFFFSFFFCIYLYSFWFSAGERCWIDNTGGWSPLFIHRTDTAWAAAVQASPRCPHQCASSLSWRDHL